MTTEKLREIIDTKNGDLERMAVNQARKLIDEIASGNQQIADIQKRLAEAKSELRALQVQQLDATSILGE